MTNWLDFELRCASALCRAPIGAEEYHLCGGSCTYSHSGSSSLSCGTTSGRDFRRVSHLVLGHIVPGLAVAGRLSA